MMKKRLLVYLILFVLFVISLTACSPGTQSSTANLVPHMPATTQHMPAATQPERFQEHISNYYSLNVLGTQKNERVTTSARDGFWSLRSRDYRLNIAFLPTDVGYMSLNEYELYEYQVTQGASPGILPPLSWLYSSVPIGFGFSILNKSNQTIRLLWNESAIVLPNGRSSKIIHSSIPYVKANREHPSGFVAPGGRFDDFAYPTQTITYDGHNYHNRPLLVASAGRLTKQDTRLFLVLEVNGERRELTFVFTQIEPFIFLR